MHRCEQCKISTDMFFCPHCGQIIRYPQFIKGNKTAENILESYIQALIGEADRKKVELSSYSNKEALADAVFRRYCNHILSLEGEADCHIANTQTLLESIKDIAATYKSKDCQIVVAGSMNSGKSMLVNALLGLDFDFPNSYSETCPIIKYRYSDTRNYVKTSYYTTDEWDSLWQNVQEKSLDSIRTDQEDFLSIYNRLEAENLKLQLLNRSDDVFIPRDSDDFLSIIEKFASDKNAHHFFIRELEIGLADFKLPSNVVLVKLHGLNDPLSFRKIATRAYVYDAKIMLICVNAIYPKIDKRELDDIAFLFSNSNCKERIYVLGTQYDMPKNFSDNWVEKTKPIFTEALSSGLYFGSQEVASTKIMPVSAWYYNLIQQALNNHSFWEEEYKVDYISEILCRCLGNDVAYKYGMAAPELKKTLKEYVTDVETQTNVPSIINEVVSGPIMDVNREIHDEIIQLFKKVRKELNNSVQPKGQLACKKNQRPRSELLLKITNLDSKLKGIKNS